MIRPVGGAEPSVLGHSHQAFVNEVTTESNLMRRVVALIWVTHRKRSRRHIDHFRSVLQVDSRAADDCTCCSGLKNWSRRRAGRLQVRRRSVGVQPPGFRRRYRSEAINYALKAGSVGATADAGARDALCQGSYAVVGTLAEAREEGGLGGRFVVSRGEEEVLAGVERLPESRLGDEGAEGGVDDERGEAVDVLVVVRGGAAGILVVGAGPARGSAGRAGRARTCRRNRPGEAAPGASPARCRAASRSERFSYWRRRSMRPRH